MSDARLGAKIGCLVQGLSRRFPAVVAVAIVLLVVGAAVVLSGTLFKPAESTLASARPGSPAPQIALPIVGGGVSDLRGDRGKVVLVNFWATWCEPCKAEMAALQSVADELRSQPFALYSVNLQEDPSQIEAFAAQNQLRLFAVLDASGDVTRAYGVRALPASFLIDRGGLVRHQRLGPLVAGGPETPWTSAWVTAQVRGMLATS